MSEPPAQRRRRKFAAGLLDQLASALGAIGGGAFTAGVLGPVLAQALGTVRSDVRQIIGIDAGLAIVTIVSALIVKGWAKTLDDDRLHQSGGPAGEPIDEPLC